MHYYLTLEVLMSQNAEKLDAKMKARYSQLRRQILEDVLGESVEEYENFSITNEGRKQHRRRVPLWKFLLHLLNRDTTSRYMNWNKDYPLEFCINDTIGVANLWGSVKNKSDMTYEKFGRAMRYYYGKNIIEKVCGRRYSYRFILSWRTRKYISQFVNISEINQEDQDRNEECKYAICECRSSIPLSVSSRDNKKREIVNNNEASVLPMGTSIQLQKSTSVIGDTEFTNTIKNRTRFPNTSPPKSNVIHRDLLDQQLTAVLLDMPKKGSILQDGVKQNVSKLADEMQQISSISFLYKASDFLVSRANESISAFYLVEEIKNEPLFNTEIKKEICNEQAKPEELESHFELRFNCKKDPFMGSNQNYDYEDKFDFEKQTSFDDVFEH